MNEQLLIAKIRTMTAAEVDRQLEEVRKTYRDITSLATSELANAREWLNSSPLFTHQDLGQEMQNLDLTCKLKETQSLCKRLEEELIKRKNQLTNHH